VEPLTPTLTAELDELVRDNGCELLHIEFKGGILRLVIDHPDGVTLEDCATISRQASPLLDLEEFDGRYTLEVSSPGLDRPLYRSEDYQRFRGKVVRVRFRDAAGGGKKTVVGELGDFDADDGGAVTVTEGDGGRIHRLPLRDIESARLEIEL